jgi:hypothetical protein
MNSRWARVRQLERGVVLGCLLAALPMTLAAQSDIDVAIPDSVVSRPLATAPRAGPDAEGNFVIDVLVLVTPLAEARLPGGGRPLADQLIASANQYFVNSLMTVRYRLVGFARSTATSESKDYLQNQADIAADAGVRQIRDQVGADLVALLRANEPSNICGIGGLFNGGQQTDPPQNVDPERDAFVVVGAAPGNDGRACADLEQLFAHELGHCMGGGHQYLPTGVPVVENGQVVLGSYWKPYAHATYCGLTSNGQRNNTIMMGGIRVEGVYLQGGNLRSDYFSNPGLVVDGLACGSYVAGLTEAEADNARSITEAAPYVAAYRVSSVARQEGFLGGGGLSSTALALLGLLRILRMRIARQPSARNQPG